jgi:hypothetical protein
MLEASRLSAVILVWIAWPSVENLDHNFIILWPAGTLEADTL